MIIRQAKKEEVKQLFIEGYKFWSKNRTLEQYEADNSKEDAYGTRYVAEVKGEIVSSLILLTMKDLSNIKVYGIGSVVTPVRYSGNGYATELLKYSISQVNTEDSIIFLYSDVLPEFYERLGFRILPEHLQISKYGICMALCKDIFFDDLASGKLKMISEYF